MNKGDKLYINVGGKGLSSNSSTNGILLGGYNGGGNAYVIASSCSNAAGSGGGATHISLASGLLSSFETKIDNILIVAAGGGGSLWRYCISSDNTHSFGGSAGGYVDNSSKAYSAFTYILSTGGSQIAGGVGGTDNNEIGAANGNFGLGGFTSRTGGYINSTGGGAGLYGGGSGMFAGGGGGSSYIGNSLLTDKVMYCYNCEESTEESTKTISTTNVSEEAIINYAKQGNGYAKITYLGEL